jgi:hypothetical protein
LPLTQDTDDAEALGRERDYANAVTMLDNGNDKRFEDIPSYARCVSLEEISDTANDFNLHVRRYVDNSPPLEPHDVRAHLMGGVPIVEIEMNVALFEGVGFEPAMHSPGVQAILITTTSVRRSHRDKSRGFYHIAMLSVRRHARWSPYE